MKKFMSMALALVMVLSLFTFTTTSASASNFTDADEIPENYREAIDVINAIKVMDGYAEGDFRPGNQLTRGAATKIICNMILGPTTANALPTSANPFPDVLSGSTFAGYIAYCTEHGIISGYADGYFRPSDPLSGYAFLKMLLCALGYNQEIEGYVGSNWKVNVAKQALGIHLDDGMTEDEKDNMDWSATVTRAAAALYAFNTLKSDLVEYDGKTTVEVNGAVVTVGGGSAKVRTDVTTNSARNNIYNNTVGGVGGAIMQFGEMYFDRLVRNGGNTGVDDYETDDFGRPSTKWTWRGSDIGTYGKTVSKTYVGNVKANQIYADLKMSTSDDAELYVNGVLMEGPAGTTTVEIARGKDKKISEYVDDAYDVTVTGAITGTNNPATAEGRRSLARFRIGDGSKVEVYRNENTNHVIICAISVYGGKVTGVKGRTSKKEPCVIIDYDADRRPDSIDTGTHNEFETTDFVEDDVVWYTYSDDANSIQEMGKMDPIEGSLTRHIIGKNLTINNTAYPYAKEVAFDGGNFDEDSLTNKSDYIVYCDENGYALWIEEADFAADVYGLIERISIENEDGIVVSSVLTERDASVENRLKDSIWSGERVRILTTSGTLRTLTLNESKAYRNKNAGDRVDITEDDGTITANYVLTAGEFLSEDFRAGNVVRFVQQSDGTYKLSRANTSVSDTSGAAPFTITKKRLNNLEDEYNVPLSADADTVFIVKDGSSYKRYVGVKNVPNIASATDGTDAVAFAYYKDGSSVAKIVFITHGKTSNTSSEVTFIAAASATKLIRGDDDYYEYNAVVKGEITTVGFLVDAKDDIDGWNATTDPDDVRDGFYIDEDNHRATESWQSILYNNVSYDSSDLIDEAKWDVDEDVTRNFSRGIKKVNSESIKIDTYWDADSSKDLAEDVKIYFVDDDGVIERVTLSEIRTDKDDFIFYTEEDGEITNLFVCEWEADDE